MCKYPTLETKCLPITQLHSELVVPFWPLASYFNPEHFSMFFANLGVCRESSLTFWEIAMLWGLKNKIKKDLKFNFRDELSTLKIRMSALESQTKGGGQTYSVRFAQPLNEQNSLPVSRVNSMASSSTEYADAVDEWPSIDERTALISSQNNGQGVTRVIRFLSHLNLHCSFSYHNVLFDLFFDWRRFLRLLSVRLFVYSKWLLLYACFLSWLSHG